MADQHGPRTARLIFTCISAAALCSLSSASAQARVEVACVAGPAEGVHEYFESMSNDLSISRDGRELVFGRGYGSHQQIRILDVETGKAVCVTGGSHNDSQPSWSPDGTKIVFSSDRAGHPQIFELTLQTGAIAQLNATSRAQRFPEFSPNGHRIAFVQDEGDAGSAARTLRVMNASGGNIRILHRSPFGLNNVSWSPDGKEIYFFSVEDGPFNDLMTANIHTGEVKNLTNNTVTDSYTMTRSSVEDRILFSLGIGRDAYSRWFNYEMFGREGAARARRLTWAWGADEEQLFSPDGKIVYFLSNRTGDFEVYRMHADGTGLRQLTRQPESELTRLFRTDAAAAKAAFQAMRAEDEKARPFSARAAEATVNVLMARGELASASALADAFVEAYPESARAYRTRAYVRLKRHADGAFDDYRQAIVREGNEMQAFIQLGPDRYFEVVTEIPDFWTRQAGDMNALAYRLIGIGEPRHAVAIFKKILEANPENWQVTDSLAEAFMLYGDYDSAIRHYQKSLQLHPENSNANYHLSRIKELIQAK